MPAIAKHKVTPAQILQDLNQLSARELEKVIAQATVLRLQKRKLVLPPRESELLRLINRGLSAEKHAKLEELQQKLRDETLTSREHAQLLRLSDELEMLGAERLKALAELAAIRKTTVLKLIKEMGLSGEGDA